MDQMRMLKIVEQYNRLGEMVDEEIMEILSGLVTARAAKRVMQAALEREIHEK